MNKIYAFQAHLKESLEDPEFKKEWDKTEVEYQLARQLIEKRLVKKMSQRVLAQKAKTTQAVICRIETMEANPSLGLLKKISKALDTNISISLQ